MSSFFHRYLSFITFYCYPRSAWGPSSLRRVSCYTRASCSLFATGRRPSFRSPVRFSSARCSLVPFITFWQKRIDSGPRCNFVNRFLKTREISRESSLRRTSSPTPFPSLFRFIYNSYIFLLGFQVISNQVLDQKGVEPDETDLGLLQPRHHSRDSPCTTVLYAPDGPSFILFLKYQLPLCFNLNWNT